MLGQICDDLERVVLECNKETIEKMIEMIEDVFGRTMQRFREICEA
jgi:hypothetical protein